MNKKQNKIRKLMLGLISSHNDKLEITIPRSFYVLARYDPSYYFEYNENDEVVIINCIPSTSRDKLYQYPFIIQLSNDGDDMEAKLIQLWETPSEECQPDYYKMKCGNLLFIAELINYILLNCNAHEITLITK